MLYLILGRDHPHSLPHRQAVRPAHLARLQALQQQGRLVLAGPLPAIDSADPGEAGFQGSCIIAEFPSLDEARAWAQDDPYAEHVFATLDVFPFKQVFPQGSPS